MYRWITKITLTFGSYPRLNHEDPKIEKLQLGTTPSTFHCRRGLRRAGAAHDVNRHVQPTIKYSKPSLL